MCIRDRDRIIGLQRNHNNGTKALFILLDLMTRDVIGGRSLVSEMAYCAEMAGDRQRHMKSSALNVDFSSPSPNHLC